jgi:hypothetical protein
MRWLTSWKEASRLLRFKLSEEDRERLGLPEWVDFDFDKLLMTEAEALESAGYNTDEFLDDLRGYEVYDKQGNPVMVPVVDDDGPVLEDGKPKMVPKIRFPIRMHKAAVWIGARRVGCTVPYRDFDFDLSGLKTELEMGKDPGSGLASPS